MYRIRFHGRGGQGMKTASRILGTACFIEGYEVQDAPRYGAERRGAPMFAYVRVSHTTIYERGVVPVPDLVVVADASLMAIPAAGLLTGCTPQTILIMPPLYAETPPLPFPGVHLTMDMDKIRETQISPSHLSSLWAGGAARLCGIVTETSLLQAVEEELVLLGEEAVAKNRQSALFGWRLMDAHAGCVTEKREPSSKAPPPEWIEFPWDPVSMSAPAIRSPETSRGVITGLWRSVRPVIDDARCGKCWWNCSVHCPDSAITVNKEGAPVIDYAHCKGCLICVEECPRRAITVRPEERDPEKGDPP